MLWSLAIFVRLLPARRMPFYAVRRGRTPGIYSTWDECQDQIYKFGGARYKKFSTQAEAQAFVDGCDNPSASLSNEPKCPGWMTSFQSSVTDMIKSCQSHVSKLNSLLVDFPEDKRTEDTLSILTLSTSSLKQSVKNLKSLSAAVDQPPSDTSKRSSTSADEPPVKKSRSDDISSSTETEWHVVYTDGACTNNGKHGAQAGIGVWWGPDDHRNLSSRLLGRQTNNRAEIHAACEAVTQAKDLGYTNLEIRTDSQFMINSMTEWIQGWKKRNWKLSAGGDVKNREDFQRLDDLQQGLTIKWTHVKGHSGNVGNDAADQLAVLGAKK